MDFNGCIPQSVRSFVDEHGDEWRRVPPYGCWERVKDRFAYEDRLEKSIQERFERRNASRVAQGKRKKSRAAFDMARNRYAEYLKADCGLTFMEYLRELKRLKEEGK